MQVSDILINGKKLEENLNAVWQQYYCIPDDSLSPVCPTELNEKGIVFLGLNPSYGRPINRGLNIQYYEQPAKSNYQDCHPHFYKFGELAQLTGIQNSSSMDLLFVRGMQPGIDPIKDTDFILNQAFLTMRILEQIQTKFIIVANKLAGEIIQHNQKHLKLNLIVDKHGILRSNAIALVIGESQFMGSGKLWYSKKRTDLKKRLVEKIKLLLHHG